MKERKKGCCNARSCPCYPNCDQMMSGEWKPKRTEKMALERLDRDETELMELEKQNEEDLERLKELYPARIRQILTEVENACDSMEYEGSVMFDELPEKQRILELTRGIREKMEAQIENWEQETLQQEEDIYVMDRRPGPVYPPQPPRPPYPPQPPRPPYPPQPPKQTDWLGDLVQVLLQGEMYHRRCRHRNCRKW